MEGVNMVTIWIALLIIFFVAEILTAGAMVSLWFCFGSGAALACALLNGPLWLQAVIFVVVSVAMLLVARPLFKKLQPGVQATNADSILGKCALVTEPIDNIKGTGAISVAGKLWSARRMDGDAVLPEGQEVIVDHIEGVKAIVCEKH
ncbi:MAG: NfeD family protein [Eubacterium sp.]|nr:NfeD family protein [Eubacterium sp.]